jgi:hypothetical protein
VSRVVVCTNLTLDGVMQAPGRADEDLRGGFAHGGWGAPYAAMTEVGEYFGSAGSLLLGRRTYEDFYKVWPARNDSRFTPCGTCKQSLRFRHPAHLRKVNQRMSEC